MSLFDVPAALLALAETVRPGEIRGAFEASGGQNNPRTEVGGLLQDAPMSAEGERTAGQVGLRLGPRDHHDPERRLVEQPDAYQRVLEPPLGATQLHAVHLHVGEADGFVGCTIFLDGGEDRHFAPGGDDVDEGGDALSTLVRRQPRLAAERVLCHGGMEVARSGGGDGRHLRGEVAQLRARAFVGLDVEVREHGLRVAELLAVTPDDVRIVVVERQNVEDRRKVNRHAALAHCTPRVRERDYSLLTSSSKNTNMLLELPVTIEETCSLLFFKGTLIII